MLFSLIPKDEKFFDLLEQQSALIHQSAIVFNDLIKNWEVNQSGVDNLRNLEHECDSTTHEILDKLNRTFVTPFDREDIHILAKQLDDVVDIIQSVSERMILFRITKIKGDLTELAKVLEEAVSLIPKVISSIRQIDKPRQILDYCIEINRLENKGDRVSEKAIGNLFQNEKDPMEVIKWKEIYDSVEFAIDRCEDIANTIEGIVVKYG